MYHISKDAFVMAAYCPKNEGAPYGITVDKLKPRSYSMIWAFKLNKQRLKHEGFGATKVNGTLYPDSEYPGCPYCGSQTIAICNCGAAMWWQGEKVTKCPGCGQMCEWQMVESITMTGGKI